MCVCVWDGMQEAKRFDAAAINSQLRASGILDCVRIRTLAYPSRMDYKAFGARYQCLYPTDLRNIWVRGREHAPRKATRWSSLTDRARPSDPVRRTQRRNPRNAAETYLLTETTADDSEFQFGRTKIFVNDDVHRYTRGPAQKRTGMTGTSGRESKAGGHKSTKGGRGSST